MKNYTYTMLIGVPASGKSTWRTKNASADTYVASTDDYLIWWADQTGVTYHTAVNAAMKDAMANVYRGTQDAFAMNKDVIVDATNTTVESRRKKLVNVPSRYKKVAVYFQAPPELLERIIERNKTRYIPLSVIEQMLIQIVPPSLSEGFDEIIIV